MYNVLLLISLTAKAGKTNEGLLLGHLTWYILAHQGCLQRQVSTKVSDLGIRAAPFTCH